jgi:hypothetical protein
MFGLGRTSRCLVSSWVPKTTDFGRAIVKNKESPLVNFYAGTGCDSRGRVLSVIHRWSDEELERTHDYIQWLFPLTGRSAFNSQAPILDAEVIGEFHRRPELHQNLRASFVRILAFFGFSPPRGRAASRSVGRRFCGTGSELAHTVESQSFEDHTDPEIAAIAGPRGRGGCFLWLP